jgi:hypothetical protein
MGNREHLHVPEQGVHAWNKWVEDHPNILVDFSGADLNSACAGTMGGGHVTERRSG